MTRGTCSTCRGQVDGCPDCAGAPLRMPRKARNRERVRTYLRAHLGARNIECAAALGLSATTVGLYVDDIRKEWAAVRLRLPAGSPQGSRKARQESGLQRSGADTTETTGKAAG